MDVNTHHLYTKEEARVSHSRWKRKAAASGLWVLCVWERGRDMEIEGYKEMGTERESKNLQKLTTVHNCTAGFLSKSCNFG